MDIVSSILKNCSFFTKKIFILRRNRFLFKKKIPRKHIKIIGNEIGRLSLFFLFSASDFSDVSPDAFNSMMGDVNLESDKQAELAQEVLESMLLGPPTTTPAIPTRTAVLFLV